MDRKTFLKALAGLMAGLMVGPKVASMLPETPSAPPKTAPEAGEVRFEKFRDDIARTTVFCAVSGDRGAQVRVSDAFLANAHSPETAIRRCLLAELARS